jgi:hypothetical protein
VAPWFRLPILAVDLPRPTKLEVVLVGSVGNPKVLIVIRASQCPHRFDEHLFWKITLEFFTSEYRVRPARAEPLIDPFDRLVYGHYRPPFQVDRIAQAIT